jgi:hypothetical protein
MGPVIKGIPGNRHSSKARRNAVKSWINYPAIKRPRSLAFDYKVGIVTVNFDPA